MELAYNILCDIVHLGKILVVCNLIFVLNKRRNKYKYLFSVMVYVISSIAIFYGNEVIGVLIYGWQLL